MRRHLVTLLLGAALAIVVVVMLHDRAVVDRLADKAARWDEQCGFVRTSLKTAARTLRGGSGPRLREAALADLWTELSPPYESRELTIACGVPPLLLDLARGCSRRDPTCLANVADHAAFVIPEAP